MNKGRLVFAIRIVVISFLIYWGFQFGSSIYSSLRDFKVHARSKRPTIDSLYDELFRKEKLTTSLTYYIQGKQPLSTYIYNSNTDIMILEMRGVYVKSINDVVSIHKKSTDISSNVTYNSTFRTRLVEIQRISSFNEKVTHLNLNLYGDSIRLEENTEQIIYYRLKLNNMSITYGNSNLINFHVGKKATFSSGPEVELMLKKIDQKIYLILAIPKEEDVGLPKNLLLSILK